MDERYSSWLRDAVPSDVTWQTKMSEAKRIERIYGDLDDLYDIDGLEGVMGELVYSATDRREAVPNPSQIPIEGDIYNNLSSYRSATRKYQLFREEMVSSPPPQRAEPSETSELAFRYEQDLQTALIACIEQLESGLRVVPDGKERQVASGRIDVLAIDENGTYVVIELKAVIAKREVLGQIAAYMADIEDEMGSRPRGILVAPDFDTKLVSGARMIDGLQLKRYSFAFTFADHS